MPFEGVRVRGLRDLERAFARFGAAEKKMLTASLAAAAEPVRVRAQELAASRIRNIGPRWQEMRVGVTTRLVYVAPKHRRGRNPNLARPNLAPLLMDRAMSPALAEKEAEVVGLLDAALGALGDEWEA
jgi:hypothetical protein